MTSIQLNYFLYDVFTEHAFGGGPLSIVEIPIDIENQISDELMQKIAREFNYPETVFLFESAIDECLAKIRFFTISKELPLAGHPTIGTSIHLRNTRNAGDTFILELNAGPTKIEFDDGKAFMFQQEHKSRNADGIDIEMLCEAIGLTPDAINNNYPIEFSSAGLEFLMIPIKDIETLSKSSPNIVIGSEVMKPFGNDFVYLFAKDDNKKDTYKVRMYELSGNDLVEDPSTGSAAGSFTMYLHNNVADQSSNNITINQGMWMGRPSSIYTSVAKNENDDLVPRVGGNAVKIGQGILDIDI